MTDFETKFGKRLPVLQPQVTTYYLMVHGLIHHRTKSKWVALASRYFAVKRYGVENVELLGRHDLA